MARITVEDCLVQVPSRFDLVVIAAKRAKQIAEFNQTSASDETNRQNKPTLIALREIAESAIDIKKLYQSKAEKEKSDIEDMLSRMQMLDQKITEKDELPAPSNVRLFKQDEYMQQQLHDTKLVEENTLDEKIEIEEASD